MLDLKSVFLIGCFMVAEAFADLCPRKNLSSDGTVVEETVHKCAHGCCHKYEPNPCCDPPFYTGTAFTVTIACSFIVPLVMGIVLCLIIRSKRHQQRQRQERREERRRQRRMRREQERIFFTSSEFGPQVLGPPGQDIPVGSSPISPPAYSEVPESPTTPQPSGCCPAPPPYTRHSHSSSDTETDDEGEGPKQENNTTLPAV